MKHFLGIDIGTSATKVVAFDERGNISGQSFREYPLYQEHAGWAEQSPSDWWEATCGAIKEILSADAIRSDDIGGIGLSGQMHGVVLLGRDDLPLRKAIIWCDQRTADECSQITSIIGKDRLVEISANPALTGFSASKILWVKNHEPEIFAKISRIFLPKDYIRFMLTGESASEYSDASGTQLLDVKNRCWSPEILSKLGIERKWLGDLYESCEVTGKISKRAADLSGLKEGTPVVGGAGDQAACAVGNGIIRNGIVSSTIGTSGVVFACTDKALIDPLGRVHTFCHAVPGKYHLMGVTQGAGLSLKWFRDTLCQDLIQQGMASKTDPYEIMDEMAGQSLPGSNGIIFLPYLMGERTPHLDPNARGVFFGITARHVRGDMIRAIMEGVSFSLRDCMEIIELLGIPVEKVRVSGGGGKSLLWRQLQSDIFNKTVETVSSIEASALGVALLAATGTGSYSSVEEACSATVACMSERKPDPLNVKQYNKSYGIYRKIYPALKTIYREAAAPETL
jgi:xylulokinase